MDTIERLGVLEYSKRNGIFFRSENNSIKRPFWQSINQT